MSPSTPQQHKRGRGSTSGSDILSRMLQLEKISQQHRGPSSSPEEQPAQLASPQQTGFPNRAARPPSRQLEALSPLRPLRQYQKPSEAVSNPLTDKSESWSVPAQNKKAALSAGLSDADICRSPSWSEYRGDKQRKENKKAEKDQKEMDKKKRKEEEKNKAAEIKTRKRLSRRPPAAMDTQRNCASLRTSTDQGTQAQPLSESSSRSSSRESGRRSSISSLKSFLGFSRESLSKSAPSQSPSMQDHHISNAAAQSRGRLRASDGHSRNASFDTYGIAISDDEDYGNGLIGFAYELQASPEQPNQAGAKKAKGVRISLPAGQSPSQPTPPPSRSDDEGTPTETKKSNVPINFSRRPLASRRGSSEAGFFNKQKIATGGDTGKLAITSKNDGSSRPTPSESAATTGESAGPKTPSRSPRRASADPVQQTTPSSRDGGSYVHKQRMYQQQRSIAGYQDELAIEIANRPRSGGKPLGLGTPTMPPTPSDSAESLSEGERMRAQSNMSSKLQGDNRGVEHSSSSEEESFDKYHQYRAAETQNRATRLGRKAQGMSKVEKMLGAKRPDVEKTLPSGPNTRPHNFDRVGAAAASKPSSTALDIGIAKAPERRSRLQTMTEIEDLRQRADASNTKERSPVPQESKAKLQATPSKQSKAPSLSRFPTDLILSHSKASRMVEHFSGPELPTTYVDFWTKKEADAAKNTQEPNSKEKITYPGMPDSSKELNVSSNSKEPSAPSKPQGVKNSASEAGATAAATNGDGSIRKPSLNRPRSDPEIKVSTDAPPTFDFLPELRHQPLVKPKRTSPIRVSFAASPTTIPPSTTMPSSSSSSPTPRTTTSGDADIPPMRSPLHVNAHIMTKPSSSGPIIKGVATTTRPRNSLMSSPALPLMAKGNESQEALNTKPLGKMFVICCKCKYWHDMPSRLYEAMALPRKIGPADGVAQSVGAKRASIDSKKASADTKRGSGDVKGGLGELWKGKGKEDKGKGKAKEEDNEKGKAVEGKVYTTVKCPWCEHDMGTACCAGWTAIVYLHERHH
ncbi:hypothetical protein MMC30_004113 [Trapelia coarctata]|nr:hypothetical protein [Trapelia coarctata]